jgi:ATP-dependent Clp protease adaptor protein ClpS
MSTKKYTQSDSDTQVLDEVEVTEPKMFKVLLLNDDYTTMDFVVFILETVFSKSPAEAVNIMLTVHKQGRGLCGVYPRQIAEVKVEQVRIRAKEDNHPLRCIMEEA